MKQLFLLRLLDMILSFMNMKTNIIIGYSVPLAMLAFYHLISNARSWNNCLINRLIFSLVSHCWGFVEIKLW